MFQFSSQNVKRSKSEKSNERQKRQILEKLKFINNSDMYINLIDPL